MKKLLVVVDMQNDFVTGCLGTKEAQEIVNDIKDYAESFDGDIAFTKDTHFDGYLDTQEGKKLPVVHCISGTEGWEIVPELVALTKTVNFDMDTQTKVNPDERAVMTFEKVTFGSVELGEFIKRYGYEEVYLCGVCTGICVISNAMLAKAFNPETTIRVLSKLCACVTPQSHITALEAMKTCQIEVA